MLEEHKKIQDFLGITENKKERHLVSNIREDSVSASVTSHVSDSQMSVRDSGNEEKEKKEKDKDEKKEKSDEPLDEILLKPLKIMHRIINQNIYSQKQIIFKN